MRALAVALLLAACAPAPVEPEAAPPERMGTPMPQAVEGPQGPAGEAAITGGSRLEVVRYVGDDGSTYTAPGTWHDASFGVECAIQIAEDGRRRCLPSAGLALASPDRFSDSSCSFPVALEGATACPREAPRFAFDYADGCALGLVIFHVGREVAEVWRRDAGECVPVAVQGRAWELIRLPPSRFVGF